MGGGKQMSVSPFDFRRLYCSWAWGLRVADTGQLKSVQPAGRCDFLDRCMFHQIHHLRLLALWWRNSPLEEYISLFSCIFFMIYTAFFQSRSRKQFSILALRKALLGPFDSFLSECHLYTFLALLTQFPQIKISLSKSVKYSNVDFCEDSIQTYSLSFQF